MTINVALVTAEALIMGCDSMASVTTPMLDPFTHPWLSDDKGKLVKDAEGRYLVPIEMSDVRPVVENLMSGVTKMFLICAEPPIVATTAGAAKLNDRTMNGLAQDFCEQQSNSKKPLVNVEPVANAFLRFVRKEFSRHYRRRKIPAEFREGPEFLVGGYGRDDAFPSLYRLVVSDNKIIKEFSPGEAGLSWNGQAESIERIIRGYDSGLRRIVEQQVEDMFERHQVQLNDAMIRIINDLLTRLKAELPEDLDTSLPGRAKAKVPWDAAKLSIDYGNMPLQNAVDFVSWLVLTQSGRAKFARGLPTVGGRTHIGVVTKTDGFQMLGEPELEHRYTGFAHDL